MATGFLLPSVQSNSMAAAMNLAWGVPGWVIAVGVVIVVAFLMLSTGAYRVFDGESANGRVIADPGLLNFDVEPGPAFVQTGFDTVWNGAGSTFIAISLGFFALTSIVAFYYVAETNLRFLLGKALPVRVPIVGGSVGSGTTRLLQAMVLMSVVIGAVSTATVSWELADIGVGMMVWLNTVGILMVQQPPYKALRDYERQKRAGLDPIFDPRALGITGATFWETYGSMRKDQVAQAPA